MMCDVMKNKILESSIDNLDLEENILNKLKSNNLLFVKDLWNSTRKDLKSINLTDREIQKVIIKLQLKGLDLNKRKY